MIIPIATPVHNWRNAVTKSSLYPIHLRITFSGQSPRYYPINVPQKISAAEWTGVDGAWVGEAHPFAFEINTRISELKAKLTALIKRFYLQEKAISFVEIERELLRKGDLTMVNAYFRSYIDRPPDGVHLHLVTWEKYAACLMHLDRFKPSLRFSAVDDTLLARFKQYLSQQPGRGGSLQGATIKSYFDKLRVVLLRAARQDRLLDSHEVEEYFKAVPIPVGKRKERQYLELDEVRALRSLSFDSDEHSLARDRDIFLLQVYTGLYYRDLQALNKRQLFNDAEHGSYIMTERDKTRQPTIIPLFKFPHAGMLLQRYMHHGKGLALLRPDAFIAIQAYNRNLKIIGDRLGIYRTLSNKVGRHTNAQLWIRYGVLRPVLSKMMGHQKEATTEYYYKIHLREVIEGTRSVNFEQYGI